MTFPVYLQFLSHRIHPHAVFEVIAYAAGFRLFLFLRKRRPEAALPIEKTMCIFAGCLLGALAGSKLLAWLESLPDFWAQKETLTAWEGGKTIVGGLLGGWAGVEWMKKRMGVRQSTGDLYVFPLILGMSIGRIGCFLTGLADHTHGVPTGLPWGVDFGDGIPRHPTQLYDIAFLLALGICLFAWRRTPRPTGSLFRLFLLSYFCYRFFIEFLKPRYVVLFMSAIQLACVMGMAVSLRSLRQRMKENTSGPLAARESGIGSTDDAG